MKKEKDIIDFSKVPCIYWSKTAKISYLQRRVIVYSIMYYEFNESCVSDAVYDGISKQLVRLQKEATEDEFKRTTYYYAMYDFEGSTGYYICSRLTKQDKEHLKRIAEFVLRLWRKERDQNTK